MVACLGYGVPEIVDAAAEQAERISYFYNHHFTSEPQERLADRLLEVVAPGMARVRLVSGGSEANETALQLARLYHVERGDTARWRVISQAQSYHGSTMGTLALTGRRALQEPYTPYLASHLHIPPSTWRFDPTGEAALEELDRLLDEAGPETVAAFFCEPVSAAALPAASPPDRFWKGLAERRDEHGFLICFDEVVSGIGRVGTLARGAISCRSSPTSSRSARVSAPGYAPLGAVLCRQHVYDAIDRGSREFDLGHTWDGAPLSSAVGLAVLDLLVERGLVDRVRDRGPGLRDELEAALEGSEIVREVRGRGFLLGVELVDPRDGESFLPVDLDVASLVDDTAFEQGLLVTSTHPQADGFAGDQTLLAPAYVTHRRGARGDRRSLPGDDRVGGAVDQGLAAGRGHGMSSAERSEEFVLLAIPDMNGSLRGKALRPAAFEAAVQHGTVMTDLIIGLDPVDTPITDYERFGIRTGRGRPAPAPPTWTPSASSPGGPAGGSASPRRAGRTAARATSPRARCSDASWRRVVARLRRDGGDRVRGPDLGRAGRAALERDQLQPGRDRPLRPVRRRSSCGALEGAGRRALRRAHGGRARGSSS